jgi:hypothetical protein
MRHESNELKNEICAAKRIIKELEEKSDLGLIDTDGNFYDYLDRCKKYLKTLKKRKN